MWGVPRGEEGENHLSSGAEQKQVPPIVVRTKITMDVKRLTDKLGQGPLKDKRVSHAR